MKMLLVALISALCANPVIAQNIYRLGMNFAEPESKTDSLTDKNLNTILGSYTLEGLGVELILSCDGRTTIDAELRGFSQAKSEWVGSPLAYKFDAGHFANQQVFQGNSADPNKSIRTTINYRVDDGDVLQVKVVQGSYSNAAIFSLLYKNLDEGSLSEAEKAKQGLELMMRMAGMMSKGPQIDVSRPGWKFLRLQAEFSDGRKIVFAIDRSNVSFRKFLHMCGEKAE